MCGVLKKSYQLTAVSRFQCHKSPCNMHPKTVCALHNQPPPMEVQCFLEMLSSFSVGILPEGVAFVGVFPNLYGSRQTGLFYFQAFNNCHCI